MDFLKIQKINQVLASKGLTNDYSTVIGQIQMSLDQDMRDLITLHMDAIDPFTATGPLLRSLAQRWGVQLRGPRRAQAYVEDMVFKFYTDTTFGAINDGNDITITTVRIFDENSEVLYTNVTPITLSADDNEEFVSIVALNAGKAANIGAHRLTRHDFTNYTKSANQLLKCDNIYPIKNGDDGPTDAEIRLEIIAARAKAVADNTVIVKALAYSVPDVADVYVSRNGYGGGSFVCYILSTYGYPATPTLNAVKSVFNRVECEADVLPMERIFMSCSLTAYMDSPRGDAENTKNAIEEAVIEIFNNNIRAFIDTDTIERISVKGVERIVVSDLIGTREKQGIGRKAKMIVRQPYEMFTPALSDNVVKVDIKWKSLQRSI